MPTLKTFWTQKSSGHTETTLPAPQKQAQELLGVCGCCPSCARGHARNLTWGQSGCNALDLVQIYFSATCLAFWLPPSRAAPSSISGVHVENWVAVLCAHPDLLFPLQKSPAWCLPESPALSTMRWRGRLVWGNAQHNKRFIAGEEMCSRRSRAFFLRAQEG